MSAQPSESAKRAPHEAAALDLAALRAQFPILSRQIHGKPLIYFDNANTAQKPLAVLQASDDFYRLHNANVARAVHTLSEEATALYEATRGKIAGLLKVADPREIVHTRGTTEAINLVAHGWLRPRLRQGDEVLVTTMEHHANIVPWQLACAASGASLKVVSLRADGSLDLDSLEALLGPRTRLCAVAHVSNVLGTINPIAAIAARCRAAGVPLLVDGSQAVPHLAVDVPALGCDFYCFTGHKLYGPTGTGALWGRYELLEAMQPFMGGGEMIETVSFEGSVYAAPPRRFEAGTPNIAGVVGLGAAIDWWLSLDHAAVATHEAAIGSALRQVLLAVPGLRLIGDAAERLPVYSFLIDGVHATDLAMLLDHEGVAVRSGQHCAHPLMRHYGVNATARASLALYNSMDEVERFALALDKVRRMLA